MSGTAEVYPDATLTPGKLELLASWMPKQAWFQGSESADLERIGSFRFVDPYGEVGIETLLVRAGGVVYQVPLTYRGEPLEGGEDYLVGELEHSELGHRWVYDGTGDPVYVDELLRVIREADGEADLSTGAPKTVTARGSGVVLVSNSTGQMKLNRIVDPAPEPSSTRVAIGSLDATWTQDGEEKHAALAYLY
nr:hypothetical protein [Propionibacterium sp.]